MSLHLNEDKEITKITSFLKNTFKKRGFSRALIACSGGIDSTTSLFLTVRALGANNTYALLLPYKNLHPQGKRDALLALKSVKVPPKNIIMVDIQPMVDSFASNLKIKKNDKQDQIRRGNIMARVRMIVLYDFAKKLKCLVVGTENKSEHYLGYFTRFGDEASDIEPLRHLYKTQVYSLAKFLKIPQAVLTKAPTAGLWHGQTDEGQFGFSYKDADEVLYLHFDQKLTKEQIANKGYSKKTVENILQWVADNHFKHELPLVVTNK